MKKSVKRKVEKLVKGDPLKQDHLVVMLQQTTTEYVALEEEKERYYRQNIGKADRVVIHSLYLRQIYLDSLIRKIYKMVDALISLEIDFDNEVATQIYNHYNPQIKRGLTTLEKL